MNSPNPDVIPSQLLNAWETNLDRQIAQLEDRLIEIRRHLHAHPEPSCEERETSRYIVEQLSGAGLDARLCRDGLGVIAEATLGEPAEDAPLIAIRADIDALRIQDTKSTPYASTRPGISHACGHDAHTAMVLAAALCAASCQSTDTTAEGGTTAEGARVSSAANGPAITPPGLPVGQTRPPDASRASHPASRIPHPDADPNVPQPSALNSQPTPGARLRFLFQPAEETSEGARWLVEQGAVDGCGAILGVHVDPERPVGTVGIRYGTLTAHCDEVQIVVEGQGGHSARPHHTRDPIAAAATLVSLLYQYLPRAVDTRCPSVFSVGRMTGGTLPNVIPERVDILGSLRTLDADHREILKQRIEEIVHGVKEASGTQVHLQFLTPIDAVHNDSHVTDALEQASRRVVGDDGIHLIDQPSMGGEDFSAYLARVPGALLRLGCAPPGFAAPFLHAPDFDIDERALALGTRILLRAALILTANPNGEPAENYAI